MSDCNDEASDPKKPTKSGKEKWTIVRKYNNKFSCEEAIRRVIETHESREEDKLECQDINSAC